MADFTPPHPGFGGVKEEALIKSEALDDALATPGTGQKRPRGSGGFGSEPFSAEETRSIRARLDVGLSRNETQQRPGPGGTRLTYIEGWRVIHDANQIFGFNGWSSQIVALDVRYLDETHGRFSACVAATVRITLRDGAMREDRGGGVADNMRSRGDAILKAEKEAVTDATKRALKNFGLRLGLSLYDRQHVRDLQNNRVAPQHHGQPAFTHHAAHRGGAGPSGVAATPPRQQHTPQPQRQPPQQPGPPPQQQQRPTTPGAPQQQQRPTTPATPGAPATPGTPQRPATGSPVTDAAVAARIAANREKALQKQQALRRERELAGGGARPGLSCGVGGPVGGGSRAAAAVAGAGSAGPADGVGAAGSSAEADAKIRQQEIDELSAMALAEF